MSSSRVAVRHHGQGRSVSASTTGTRARGSLPNSQGLASGLVKTVTTAAINPPATTISNIRHASLARHENNRTDKHVFRGFNATIGGVSGLPRPRPPRGLPADVARPRGDHARARLLTALQAERSSAAHAGPRRLVRSASRPAEMVVRFAWFRSCLVRDT